MTLCKNTYNVISVTIIGNVQSILYSLFQNKDHFSKMQQSKKGRLLPSAVPDTLGETPCASTAMDTMCETPSMSETPSTAMEHTYYKHPSGKIK